jgi:hypothetical protein
MEVWKEEDDGAEMPWLRGEHWSYRKTLTSHSTAQQDHKGCWGTDLGITTQRWVQGLCWSAGQSSQCILGRARETQQLLGTLAGVQPHMA